MRSFADHDPISVAVYFLLVAFTTMFSADPIVFLLSLFGAVSYYVYINRAGGKTVYLFSLVLFLVTALINPLVSHNGVTVLCVMNNNPVTLEAAVYGLFAAIMIISVFYWFASFSNIMTSDKLLHLFGALSPKLALILSMSLRYVPLFSGQAKKIDAAQKGLGLYKEDNIIDTVRGKIRVFSVMVTWALENGIVTADSMSARGYGVGKRTHFSVFRMQWADVLLLAVSLSLAAVFVAVTHWLEYTFYPALSFPEITPVNFAGYAAFTVLVLLPTVTEIKEDIKWKHLRSRI